LVVPFPGSEVAGPLAETRDAGSTGGVCFERGGSRPTDRHGCRSLVGREHAKNDQHLKRDSGFFLLGIQERFTFRPGWYREEGVRGLVLEYYFVLRTALSDRPLLRPCLTRCRHCRIFFLAHSRNRGRKDLGCPFGCRDAHRRRRSAERSKAYYRTPSGKRKKAALNGRRSVWPVPESGPGEEATGEESEATFAVGIVEHVRVVTSLIEGFEVSREEVVEMLARILRQPRMARERRIDQAVRRLAREPP